MESSALQETLESRLLQATTSAAGATTGRTMSLMAPLNFAGSSTKASWLESSNQRSCFEGAVNASKVGHAGLRGDPVIPSAKQEEDR